MTSAPAILATSTADTSGDGWPSLIVDRSGIRTASISMINRDEQRAVEIIGVVHLARKSFWHSVQARLDSLSKEGWEVHFESVASTREDRRQLRKEGLVSADGLRLRSFFPGLVYQRPGLRYRRGWRRTDMTVGELRAALGEDEFRKLYTGQAQLARLLRLVSRVSKAGPGLLLAAGLTVATWAQSKFGPDERTAVILDQRNRIAVDAISSTRANVVAVWGAAHLPGIVRELRGRGWEVSGHERLPIAFNWAGN